VTPTPPAEGYARPAARGDYRARIGAFALALHGYVRAAKGVDVVPDAASGRDEDLRDIGALEAARRSD
jgi:hypothetical protein